VTSNSSLGYFPGTMPNFSITTALDNTTEGPGSYVVNFRQGGYSGIPFFTTPPININDTSKYPYINNTPASLNEGTAFTFNVTAYDIPGSATYYWSIDSDTARFSGATSGSFTINNNAGSFTVTPIANLFTDGATNATISLRTTSVTGPIMESRVIPINDLSQTPAFTSPTGAVSVNEGTAQSFSVSGFTNGANVTFYWYINHITTIAADFSGSVTNGSFTLNNGGSFSITPIADTLSDGVISGNRIPARNETFTVSIARTSLGTAVATSPIITINDTSLSPAANITWTLLDQARAPAINFDTPVSSAGKWTVTGGPYAVGVSGNRLNVVVPSGVWVIGGLSISGGAGTDIVTVTVDGIITGYGGAGFTTQTQGATTTNPGNPALHVGQVASSVAITLSGSGILAGGGGAGGGGFGIRAASGGGAGQFASYPNCGINICGIPSLSNDFPAVLCGYSANYGQSNPASGNIQMRATGAGTGGNRLSGGFAGAAWAGAGAWVSRCAQSCHGGLGGSQGGGGGSTYAATVSIGNRGKGGNGGSGANVGGDAGSGNTTAPISAGGGGGGWGANGGRGYCTFNTRYTAGGIGGAALRTQGKTVSGSVATQYGATTF
jgi:hypothetical protein